MFRQNFFGFGWQRQLETETLCQSLASFRSEAFEMIAGEGPNIAHLAEMPFNLERPTFQRSFAFPKKIFITVHVFPVAIVFCGVIAEKPKIKKIGRAREKFERREVPFVERTGVGPNPANAMFFQQADNLRPMPAGMTKFDRETKISRQLIKEFAKRLPAILRSKRGRQLDENNLQLRSKWLDGAHERAQFRVAIAQPANVSDLAREFAREPERGGDRVDPTAHGVFRRRVVKCAVDFNRGEIAGIELQPVRVRQIQRIEISSPVVKGPSAGTDADFLLMG